MQGRWASVNVSNWAPGVVALVAFKSSGDLA